MKGVKVTTAMLLAAGLGTRMRPLTNTRPKPMLNVAGKPMIEWAIDRCVEAGVKRVVINLHYCPDVIRKHLSSRKDVQIFYSPEEELLDSGGGVKNALKFLGDRPFFCINTDLIITDGAKSYLMDMARKFDEDKMDLLMLMKETGEAIGFEDAQGDYFMNLTKPRFGTVYGRTNPAPRPYVFSSTAIIHPRVYAGIEEKIFSNRVIFDAAEKTGRLFGIVHDGGVYHASTPDDLVRVDALLRAQC